MSKGEDEAAREGKSVSMNMQVRMTLFFISADIHLSQLKRRDITIFINEAVFNWFQLHMGMKP